MHATALSMEAAACNVRTRDAYPRIHNGCDMYVSTKRLCLQQHTSFSVLFFSSALALLYAFFIASMAFCRALRMLWCACSASMLTSLTMFTMVSWVMRGSLTSTSAPSLVGFSDSGESRIDFSTALHSCSEAAAGTEGAGCSGRHLTEVQ